LDVGGRINKKNWAVLGPGFMYYDLGPAQNVNKFDFSDFSEKFKYAEDSTLF